MPDVKDLYGTHYGELAFIIGSGPSVAYAKKELSQPHKHAFTIAVNRAIEEVPADYWCWIDLVAYQNWCLHENAKAAKKLGVEAFKDKYDDDVYVWERVIGDTKKGLDDGKIVCRASSTIAAISLAFRLGAVRIVTVGCENWMAKEEFDALGPEKADYMRSTFIRVSEALANRKYWLHPKVMLADASKTGTTWGDLALPKTTISEELKRISELYDWMANERRKKWLPSAS